MACHTRVSSFDGSTHWQTKPNCESARVIQELYRVASDGRASAQDAQAPAFNALSAEYPQCAEGYTGLLCGQCLPGYGATHKSFTCARCPDRGTLATVVVLGLASVMSVLVYTIRAAIVSPMTGYQLANEQRTQRMFRWRSPANLWHRALRKSITRSLQKEKSCGPLAVSTGVRTELQPGGAMREPGAAVPRAIAESRVPDDQTPAPSDAAGAMNNVGDHRPPVGTTSLMHSSIDAAQAGADEGRAVRLPPIRAAGGSAREIWRAREQPAAAAGEAVDALAAGSSSCRTGPPSGACRRPGPPSEGASVSACTHSGVSDGEAFGKWKTEGGGEPSKARPRVPPSLGRSNPLLSRHTARHAGTHGASLFLAFKDTSARPTAAAHRQSVRVRRANWRRPRVRASEPTPSRQPEAAAREPTPAATMCVAFNFGGASAASGCCAPRAARRRG